MSSDLSASRARPALRRRPSREFPGMLHAKILFSPVPHARIKRIDTSRAEALEGVHGVVCYLNSPDTTYNRCGEEIDGHKTERVFDDTVRYVGDTGAAVAADTVKIAEQALKLIQVEYEELPFYTDPREALKEDVYKRQIIRSLYFQRTASRLSGRGWTREVLTE